MILAHLFLVPTKEVPLLSQPAYLAEAATGEYKLIFHTLLASFKYWMWNFCKVFFLIFYFIAEVFTIKFTYTHHKVVQIQFTTIILQNIIILEILEIASRYQKTVLFVIFRKAKNFATSLHLQQDQHTKWIIYESHTFNFLFLGSRPMKVDRKWGFYSNHNDRLGKFFLYLRTWDNIALKVV